MRHHRHSLARHALAAALPLAALGASASGAHAVTATTQFNVSLTVIEQCTVSATPMVFGAVSLVTAGAAATSTITVTCSAQTDYTIGLDAGLGPGATIAVRRMQGPAGATVPYSLYQNNTYTTLWGTGTGEVVAVPAATGTAQQFTVYGRVLPGQGASPAGDYTDTIGVVVTY